MDTQTQAQGHAFFIPMEINSDTITLLHSIFLINSLPEPSLTTAMHIKGILKRPSNIPGSNTCSFQPPSTHSPAVQCVFKTCPADSALTSFFRILPQTLQKSRVPSVQFCNVTSTGLLLSLHSDSRSGNLSYAGLSLA